MSINFVKQILEALEFNEESEEEIECFIIDEETLGYWEEDKRNIDKQYARRPLKWDEHKHLLNYETDPGFGGLDCHLVRIYTKDYIYYIHEYDGSHCFHSIERNPS